MHDFQQQAIADRTARQAEHQEVVTELNTVKKTLNSVKAENKEVLAELSVVNKTLTGVVADLESERQRGAALARAYAADKAVFEEEQKALHIEIKAARDRITTLEAGALSKVISIYFLVSLV